MFPPTLLAVPRVMRPIPRILTIKLKNVLDTQSKTSKHVNTFVVYCIKVLHLIENIQVNLNDQQSTQFEQWLLDVDRERICLSIISSLCLST